MAWEFECLVLEPGPGAPDTDHGGQPLLVRTDDGLRGRAPGGARRHADRGRRTRRPPLRRARPRLPRDRHRPRGRACGRPTRRSWPSSTRRPTSPGTGRQATFMAQLGPQFPGWAATPACRSAHSSTAQPALCEEPGVLSKVGAAAVAGVITLLPELLALAAPYPNSYRRFGPGNWAPSTATWGLGQLQLRAPRGGRRPGVGAPRAAHPRRRRRARTTVRRCSSASALWGIEERLDPPPPVQAPQRRPHRQPAPPHCPGTSSRRRSASGPARRRGTSSAPPSSSTTPRPAGSRRRPAIASSPTRSAPATWLRSERTTSGRSSDAAGP